MSKKQEPGRLISVIVPVWREVEAVNPLVAHLRELAGKTPLEIVVADGAPGADTLAAIEDPDVVRVACPPGRGVQMNAGAAAASGDVFLFLHADTRLPRDAFGTIRRLLDAGLVRAGAFDLDIDSDRPGLRAIAFFGRLRSRLERAPYGDQAPFVRADLFREVGGFAEIPLMEDVEFFHRLKGRGEEIAILPDRALTSARRWLKEGAIRCTLRNWLLRLLYALGASPAFLARRYRPHHETAPKEPR